MPYPPRPPTPQGVGAALKRAGFNRADPRGAGYKVRKSKSDPAFVDVFWEPDSRAIGPMKTQRVRALLRYADTLLVAGFRCQFAEASEKVTVYARRR